MSNICEQCPVAKICPDSAVVAQQPEDVSLSQSKDLSTVVQGMKGLNDLSSERGIWADWGMCGALDSHG